MTTCIIGSVFLSPTAPIPSSCPSKGTLKALQNLCFQIFLKLSGFAHCLINESSSSSYLCLIRTVFGRTASSGARAGPFLPSCAVRDFWWLNKASMSQFINVGGAPRAQTQGRAPSEPVDNDFHGRWI